MGIESDGIEAGQQVVLAHIQAGIILEAFETRVWETLIVVAPADALVLEEIDDGGDVAVDEDEAVAVQAEGVAAGWGDVVGLARGSDAVHIR